MPMDVEIWRELCREPDLQRSIPVVFGLLAKKIDLLEFSVRRVDAARARVETVAEHARGEARGGVIVDVAPTELAALLAWIRRSEPQINPMDEKLFAGRTIQRRVESVVVAPLEDTVNDTYGSLVLSLGVEVTEATAFARALMEPFALALTNHLRVHELMRLREALEADKQALLTRLDRQDITETIVGADRGLSEVMQAITQVAPTDAPVLILGETGSGKEVVARAIHQSSRRAKGPMVRVNCGAISPGLIDSELFGHEKGAFTGAVAQRSGWFERADGGTLFLDEIGELPLDAQVRLLRVLQEGVVERVGGQRPIHVDVRIIAATHRNLEEMVDEGSFRRDLWYRLSVFLVPLPPLRDRKSDVAALATHFAARAGRRLGGAPIVPRASDVELLLNYDWPGNVRELAAVIERAAILGDGRSLDLVRALGSGYGVKKPPSVPPAIVDGTAVPTLDTGARLHIERALEATRGRVEGKGGAAELLGINPHTLRSRMRKLGIEWQKFRK